MALERSQCEVDGAGNLHARVPASAAPLVSLHPLAGTQPGTTLVMSKRGVPKLGTANARGDHLVHVKASASVAAGLEVRLHGVQPVCVECSLRTAKREGRNCQLGYRCCAHCSTLSVPFSHFLFVPSLCRSRSPSRSAARRRSSWSSCASCRCAGRMRLHECTAHSHACRPFSTTQSPLLLLTDLGVPLPALPCRHPSQQPAAVGGSEPGSLAVLPFHVLFSPVPYFWPSCQGSGPRGVCESASTGEYIGKKSRVCVLVRRGVHGQPCHSLAPAQLHSSKGGGMHRAAVGRCPCTRTPAAAAARAAPSWEKHRLAIPFLSSTRRLPGRMEQEQPASGPLTAKVARRVSLALGVTAAAFERLLASESR